MYQNRKFVLHASAISISNKAILFLGKSGSGKSSLCASLLGSSKFITEDVALIDFEKDNAYIHPSHSFIKLSDDIAKKLKINSTKIVLNGDRASRNFYKINNKQTLRTKIDRCYLLDWSDNFSIQSPDPEKILAYLINNTFSSYPLTACHESVKIFMKNIERFIKSIDIMEITRNKKDFFLNNNAILKDINR